MEKIISFDDALKHAEEDKKHLLLGNGFSMGYDEKPFSSGAFHEWLGKISEEQLKLDQRKRWSMVHNSIEKLKTANVEEIFKYFSAFDNAIDIVKTILEIIKSEKDLKDIESLMSQEIKNIEKDLKYYFIRYMSECHPVHSSIPDSKKDCCLSFLTKFNNIYTLNFDLLLYWVRMHREKELFRDNFTRTRDCGNYYAPENYRIAENDGGIDSKINVIFLHGALHIFSNEQGIYKKVRNKEKNIGLMDLIKLEMEEGNEPICVLGGSAEQKKRMIYGNNNWYLRVAYDKLMEINGSLFIYGCSLKENDYHILEAIGKSDVSKIFISVLNNKISVDKERAVEKIKEVRKKKEEKLGIKESSKLEFYFFDANSANVWGKIM